MKKKSIILLATIIIVAATAFIVTGNKADSLFSKDNYKNVLEDGMAAFSEPHGDWVIEDEQLILPVKNGRDERTNIWIKDEYGDFILELDFKLDKNTNSGVFFRTKNIQNPVQTGIEVQLRDDYGKSPIDMHFCGSIYEIKKASENRVKAPGEWNHLKLTAKGSHLEVVMNDGKVVDINLDEWTEVGKNPDGSENKYKTAYKDMPRSGRIGFQDHGGIVTYKNIRIKDL